VIIRAATPADLPAIAAIQAASPEASQWRPADYLRYCCQVAEAGDIEGFIVTRETAPGECELLNLAVAPAARRKGVGRALLERVIGSTPAAWYLEVRESNLAGIRFYEQAGFVALSRRPGYYQGSPEPAIVMVLKKVISSGCLPGETPGG
jgi:ribosomal protein S18 acetylase RimI-like enzyme